MVKIHVEIIETLTSVNSRRKERFIEISVEDTGIGISDNDQNKLFKLFGFIQDSQQMNTQGIGLGLVIADQIVSQFNGKIKFKSRLGIGSTFTFTFKLDEEEIRSIEQI